MGALLSRQRSLCTEVPAAPPYQLSFRITRAEAMLVVLLDRHGAVRPAALITRERLGELKRGEEGGLIQWTGQCGH